MMHMQDLDETYGLGSLPEIQETEIQPQLFGRMLLGPESDFAKPFF